MIMQCNCVSVANTAAAHAVMVYPAAHAIPLDLEQSALRQDYASV
jgi:hypothetical protein